MTDVTTSRPGLAARDEARHLPVSELVSRLRDALGVRLVAYIASQPSASVLRDWISGSSVPTAETVERLRAAYLATAILRHAEGKSTVQSWFQGTNPQLEDNAPAQLLRDEPLSKWESRVEGAAQAAAAVG